MPVTQPVLRPRRHRALFSWNGVKVFFVAGPRCFDVDTNPPVKQRLRTVDLQVGTTELDDLGDLFAGLLIGRYADADFVVWIEEVLDVGWQGNHLRAVEDVGRVDFSGMHVGDGYSWRYLRFSGGFIQEVVELSMIGLSGN